MSLPLLPATNDGPDKPDRDTAGQGHSQRLLYDWEIRELFDTRLKQHFEPIAVAMDRNSDALQGMVLQSTLMLGDGKFIPGEIPKVLQGLGTLQADMSSLRKVVDDHHEIADKRFGSIEDSQTDLNTKVEELSRRRFLIIHGCILLTDWLGEKNPVTGRTQWERIALFLLVLTTLGGFLRPLLPSGHIQDFFNWLGVVGGRK